MEKRQMKFMPNDKYIDKVLVGNWFENRREFVKNPHDFKTNYFVDYTKKPTSSVENFVWDQRFKWQGYGARLIFDHQSPHFLENFSTLYDLSYNHYPKNLMVLYQESYDFVWKDTNPYKIIGNVTNYGLVGFQKEKWNCDNSDPRRTLLTNYQDAFAWPKPDKTMSWGIPTSNSSKINRNNCVLYNFKSRNTQILAVPENCLKQFPQKAKCNPITWECPDPMEDPKPCKGLPIKRKRRKF